MLGKVVPKIMVYGQYNSIQQKFMKGTRISSSAYITEKSKLDIGDNVWVNHNARTDASGGVKIGDGCQIGYGAMILSHSSHMAIRLNGSQYIKKDISERIGYIHKPVEIGAYTFIGGGAAVMPGVKIGKGCVEVLIVWLRKMFWTIPLLPVFQQRLLAVPLKQIRSFSAIR